MQNNWVEDEKIMQMKDHTTAAARKISPFNRSEVYIKGRNHIKGCDYGNEGGYTEWAGKV